MIILCKPDSRYTIIKITYKVSGMVLIISMFAFNFVGDGLRDALDPKLKK